VPYSGVILKSAVLHKSASVACTVTVDIHTALAEHVAFNTSDVPAIFIRILFILIFKIISLNLSVLSNLVPIYTLFH
jgi:hypothetical protein